MIRRHATWDLPTQRNLRIPLYDLKLAISHEASYAVAYVAGILSGFPGASALAVERARCPFSQCSEVLASVSAARSVIAPYQNFSPMADA